MGNVSTSPESLQLFTTKYELGDRIATGTFATVRYCKRRSDGKEFAVKIVKKSFCTENELLLLQDEIDIYSSTKHPNIINIYDVYQNANTVKMVLELCERHNLADVMYNSPNFRLTEYQCAYITLIIGKTLKYLHSKQIVHRDLKPENILFTKGCTLKLTDFGSAFTNVNRRSQSVSSNDNDNEDNDNEDEKQDYINNVPEMHTVIGTPNYAAPEILRRQPYTCQVDVWSLGVILFQCLCGYHPFLTRKTLKSINKLYAAIIIGKYKFEAIWDEIDGTAMDLVKQLIVIDPKLRLTTHQLLQAEFLLKYENKKGRNPFCAKDEFRKSTFCSKDENIYSKPITLKSGILYKKGAINTYQQRLFELNINGLLQYFEIKPNGEKIKKGELLLNPSIEIEKRSGGIRRDAKFIIHINEKEKWYLWYNHDLNGKKEAQEWCNILQNAIQNIKYVSSNPDYKYVATKNNNNYKIKNKQNNNNKNGGIGMTRSKSYAYGCDDELYDMSIEDGCKETNMIIKENYLMLKSHGIYKQMYFVLNINGILDYYTNENQKLLMKDKKGCIDLLKECMNVEKRNGDGSQKKDAKFIIYTKKNTYYIWCKDNKSLSFEWYYAIKRIIMRNISK